MMGGARFKRIVYGFYIWVHDLVVWKRPLFG